MNDERPVEHNFAYNHEVAERIRMSGNLWDALQAVAVAVGSKATVHLENLIYAELSKRQGLAE